MKKLQYALLFIVLVIFGSNKSQAQENNVPFFRIVLQGGFGNGIVDNANTPDYVLNSNSAEVLLNYRINETYGIATGVGYSELNGTGFNSAGNFFHDRMVIKVPVMATLDVPITDKFKMLGTIGFFGQTIVKDEYEFTHGKVEDIYEGWSFGSQFSIGFLFEIFKGYSAGLNYQGQSDLTKVDPRNSGMTDNPQKLKNLNKIGVIFMIDF